jgi:hypothetical protein
LFLNEGKKPDLANNIFSDNPIATSGCPMDGWSLRSVRDLAHNVISFEKFRNNLFPRHRQTNRWRASNRTQLERLASCQLIEEIAEPLTGTAFPVEFYPPGRGKRSTAELADR